MFLSLLLIRLIRLIGMVSRIFDLPAQAAVSKTPRSGTGGSI
jgi:hypothetical protein